MGFFHAIRYRFLRRPYKLGYIEAGQGEQVAVLLHGLAASKDIWSGLIQALPLDKWRVLAPDLMGFGDSPKPQRNTYATPEHARMVLALLKSQKIKGPIVLVGHSMGCLVAAHIAASSPKLVGRLVLYEPPLLGDVPEFPAHSKRSARYKAFFEYIASHPQLASTEGKILWRVARKISGLTMSKEEWLPFEQSLRNTILNQQTYEELRSITTPTDIVYGRLDLVVIRRGIQAMFGHNKHIQLHSVTDVHGISARSARYLVGLLESGPKHREHPRKSA